MSVILTKEQATKANETVKETGMVRESTAMFERDSEGKIIKFTGRERIAEKWAECVNWCECEDYPAEVSKDSVGILKNLDVWFMNNLNLLNLLQKSPHWNDEAIAIVFDKPIHRSFNKDLFKNFLGEIKYWADKSLKQYKMGNFYMEELNDLIADCENDLSYLSRLTKYGKPIQKLVDEVKKQLDGYTTFKDSYVTNPDYKYDGWYLWRKEDWEKTNNVKRCFTHLMDRPTQFISKETEEYINGLFPNFKAKEGQKVSKVVNKLAKMLELDRITNGVLANWGLREDGVSDDNNVYNYKFAKFADGCNPFDVDKHVRISLNPIDYLTMSWGNSWTSCHTIDKDNKHGYKSDTGATYHGMYASGPISYMLDSTSIIFFILSNHAEKDAEESGEPVPRKEMRQMFHIGKDKFIQGRLYPYDQSDRGQNADPEDYVQYREIVQAVLSECWGVPNLWQPNKRGADSCCRESYSRGTHYRDYECYPNCNVSYLKEYEPTDRIEIGHDPYCLECGDLHTERSNLFCDNCREEGEYCEYHECYENESLYEVQNYNGRVCWDALQEGDDFHQCEDCGTWFYDYWGDYGVYSEREDRHFCCESCASNAGYTYCEYAEDWILDDEVEYSEIDDEYLPNYDVDDRYLCYAIYNEDGDETIARCDSCVRIDGQWYAEDICTEVDGEWYPDWILEYSEIDHEDLPTVNINAIDDDYGCDYCYAHYTEGITIARVDSCEMVNGEWYDRELCFYVEAVESWFLASQVKNCWHLMGYIWVDDEIKHINMEDMFELDKIA